MLSKANTLRMNHLNAPTLSRRLNDIAAMLQYEGLAAG